MFPDEIMVFKTVASPTSHGRANSWLRLIFRSSKNFRSPQTLITLYISLIRPILEIGWSSGRCISWITLTKFSTFKTGFCGCLVQDSISPTTRLLSVIWRIYSASFLYTFVVNTRICFSSSDWWMATSTVQHTWVASSSPYPEELAQGQSSAGSTTPPVMPTTVESVVSSQLEDQLGLIPWNIHIVQKESDVIPWVPSYPPLPTLLPSCLSILFFSLGCYYYLLHILYSPLFSTNVIIFL